MKRFSSCVFLALLVIITGIVSCFADYDRPIDSYFARLSKRDHYNSSGQRLTTVAAILRQDRANYHEFGYQDPEDDDDIYFKTREKRSRIENMSLSFSSRSPMTAGDLDQILYGTPVVYVKIYRNRLDIEIQ